jgi:hypothetical protein
MKTARPKCRCDDRSFAFLSSCSFVLPSRILAYFWLFSVLRARALRARLAWGEAAVLRFREVEDPFLGGPAIIFLEQGESLRAGQYVAGAGKPASLFQALIQRHRPSSLATPHPSGPSSSRREIGSGGSICARSSAQLPNGRRDNPSVKQIWDARWIFLKDVHGCRVFPASDPPFQTAFAHDVASWFRSRMRILCHDRRIVGLNVA